MSVKLRYADFSIVTRSQTMTDPIEDAEELVSRAQHLMRRALHDRADPIRLLGVYTASFGSDRPAQLRLPLSV